jgi:hypothetical protein
MATTKLTYTGGEDIVCHALAAEGLPALVQAGAMVAVSEQLAEQLLASSSQFAKAEPKPKRGRVTAPAEDAAPSEDTTDDEEQADA